jgi:predicted nucleic acid-binding protein
MMVSGLSKLIDPTQPLALDTGVVINLAATGMADRILQALPNPIAIVDTVLDDLARNSDGERRALSIAQDLIRSSILKVAKASDLTQGYFEDLVAGDGPDTLDDGEAATIAYAVEHNTFVILDERKALRICRERYPALQIATTADILCHPAVERTLGSEFLRQSVMNALDAHMRVLPDYVDWVVELVGAEHAAKCSTIPASVRAAISKSRPTG